MWTSQFPSTTKSRARLKTALCGAASSRHFPISIYNPCRGWLDTVREDDNTRLNDPYTDAGSLATRTWARIVGGQPFATTCSYNNAGNMSGVDYSDTTPDAI